MSSEWYGGCHNDEENLSFQISKCIGEFFDEPSTYDELCFYCIEDVYCPYHEIPQSRVKIHQKDGFNKTTMDFMIDEIFNLHNDYYYQYANCKLEITSNCSENDSVKVESKSDQQQSGVISQNLSKHEQMNVKLTESESNQKNDQTVLQTVNIDDVASRNVHDDVEEIFIVSKQRSISPISDRQKYKRFRNKQYLCDICDSAFTLKHNIQTHLLLYHPNNEAYTKRRRGKRYRCLKCNTIFRTFDAVQKHQKRQHEVRRRPKCETCQKEFPTASLLREHIAIIHLNLRPFKCTKCSAVFGRQGCLRRHVMMRHLNYVYLCPYKQCTHPGFKCSKALTAHICSIHTHIRPYKCDQCEKRFVRRNDLRVHSDIHNTQCNYVCPTCEEMFQRRIHLQKHIKKCHPTVES